MIVERECMNCFSLNIIVKNEDGSLFYNNKLNSNFNVCNNCE